jgi:hypothetical protein
MAGMANDTTAAPRLSQRRARVAERSGATRSVSPCTVREPGQAEWRDRQPPGLSRIRRLSSPRGTARW